jgi:hypothetical protein
MTENTDKPRLSRIKRREEMLNSIAKLIGCTALVVTVAVVFYVIVIQLDKQGPRVDPAYVDAVESASQDYRWAGTESIAKDAGLGVSRPALPKTAIREPSAVPSLATILPGTQTVPIVTGISNIESKKPRIEEVVRQFFTANSIAEKAACSRDTQRVLPLMEVYYRKHQLITGVWQKLGWVLNMDEPGQKLAYAQSLFEDVDPVCLIIEETELGEIRIDWESSVRYSELDWQEFISTRPDQPTLFRVIASKPVNAAEALPEAGEEVIELKHPAEQGTVYAYFNRDDPQFKTLVEQLKLGNWSNVPLTLRLCYPGPTSNAKAVRIAGVEGKGWLILHKSRS